MHLSFLTDAYAQLYSDLYIQVKMSRPRPCPELDLTGTGSCASLNFRRTARAVTRLYDLAFLQTGIRSTQFTILVAVAKNQPISISGLAQILVMDRTTLTRSLRLLNQVGFLEVSERSTMRQRFVSLTRQGRDTLARSLPAWREAHTRFLDAVGTQYWVTFRDQLERLGRVSLELEATTPRSAPPPQTE